MDVQSAQSPIAQSAPVTTDQTSQQPPSPTKMVTPIFDKKTGAVIFPLERKYMKVYKEGKEVDVEFMTSLARNRMQVRVKDITLWAVGNKFEIRGKGITYTCIVKSIRKSKMVIQKIDQVLEQLLELVEDELAADMDKLKDVVEQK